jgi:hypothetical protein
MRKITLVVAALTLLVAGFVLAQVTAIPPAAETPRDFTVFTAPGKAPVAQVRQSESIQVSKDLRLIVEGEHDGRVIGTLMANVDGQWVEVILASKNMRAATAPAINRR